MRRSSDFRYVYGNTFQFTFLGHEGQIIVALQENPAQAVQDTEAQVGVIVSPVGIKSLALTLTMFIEDLEAAAGAPIPVDESVLTPIREAIAANQAARAKAKSD